MKVYQLMEILANLDENDEVRIATQPEYPLAFMVDGVAAAEDDANAALPCACGGLVEVINDEAHHLDRSLDDDHEPRPAKDYDYDDDYDYGTTDLEPGIVWLVAGAHPDSPYAPREVWANMETRW